MDGRLLAAAALALVGQVVCGPFSAVSPAWATAEPAPAPAISPPSVMPAAAPPKLVWRSVDRPVPVVLLVSAARGAAGLVAPSYAVWLIEPPHDALPGERFLARGQAVAQFEVFERIVAVPPAASASVPRPPKRLAENRSVLLAMAPLPPKRLVELMPPASQALAMAPIAPPPNDVMPLRDAAAAAEPDAADPQVDAAKPIDDGPEPVASRATADLAPPQIEALIQRHAERFDVPARLVRRVAWRESKFDHRKRNGPYWGLMQIRVDTARGLGFRGTPSDLLDADTNMSYAAAYLANAYRVAGRDEKRAVMLYAKGYYYEAKRKRMLDSLIRTAAAEKDSAAPR